MEAYGIERNPFLQLVANTKVQALCEGSASFEDFIARLVSHRRRHGRSVPVPELSTLHDERYFSRRSVTDLAAIRSWIDDTPGSTLDKNLARVCLAPATVEPAGRLRKDGRALRYEANRQPCDVYDEFRARCQVVADDLRSLKPARRKRVRFARRRTASLLRSIVRASIFRPSAVFTSIS